MLSFIFTKQHSYENLLISRRMQKIAWPLSLNTMVVYLLVVIDSVFIGHYDSRGLDILNTIIMPYIALNQLMDYVHMGTVIPVSHALGERNYPKARSFIEAGFFVYGILGMLFFLFWKLFSTPIYHFLIVDESIQKIAVDYIAVLSYTYLIQSFGYKGMQAFFSATGSTHYLLIAGIIQIFVNILTNRILIYGDFFFPEMGVVGAAWGTLISMCVGWLVLFYFLSQFHIIKPKFSDIFSLKKEYILRTLRLGLPIGIDMVLWGFGGLFLIWIINHTDPTLNRFMFFFIILPEVCFRVYSGYILAVTNLVGRSYGSGDWKKIFKIMRFGLIDTLALSIFVSMIYVVFPKYVAYIFTQDFDTIRILQKYIPFMCFIMLVRTVWEIFNSTLHGIGVTFWGILVQFIGLFFIVLQAYFYVGKFHWGILGIFFIYTVDEVLRLFFMSGRLWYEKKKHQF